MIKLLGAFNKNNSINIKILQISARVIRSTDSRPALTYALSNSCWATIRVLSFMSLPGPDATHSSLGLHEGPGMSQGRPDFWHLGPLTFGVTSPRLDDANAATNGPCSIRIKRLPLIMRFASRFLHPRPSVT